MLQVQTAHADKQTLQKLKRKYIASPLGDISNQQTVCREGVKRRLILSDLQDSGYGNTLETLETPEQVDEEVQGRGCGNTQNGGSQNSTYSNNSEDSVIHMDIDRNNETPTQQLQDLFKSSNLQGKLYYKFKEVYGIPFSELVHTFKSDSF